MILQEAALIRVALLRLSQYLLDDNLTVDQIKAIAPLIFTGTRALAFIQHQVIEKENEVDWDAVLDDLSDHLGIDL